MFGYLNGLDLLTIGVRVLVVLLAMTLHELAHGYTAYKLGDPTAKSMGRLSLNPLRHIDPIGALCMIVFRVGWAKPVMVNPLHFKNPKRDMALVSFAGPLANFALAFVSIILYALCGRFLPVATPMLLARFISVFLTNMIILNIGLGVFNLLPIPPLDGAKVWLSLLPNRTYYNIMQHERLGWIVLIAALALGVLDRPINIVVNAIFNGMFFLVSWI